MGLSSGQMLAQRYRLGRRIAVGGMGEVWQADDTRLDRPVAVRLWARGGTEEGLFITVYREPHDRSHTLTFQRWVGGRTSGYA